MAEAIRQGDIPGVQLRCRKLLVAGPAEAWRWLVEPERLARWLADEARIEPGPAGPPGALRLAGVGERGEPLRELGRTLEFDPPRLWVLAFERLDAGWPAATRLALEVRATPEGAEVDVLQEGFQRLPLSVCLTHWEAYRRRWRAALERLGAAVAAP